MHTLNMDFETYGSVDITKAGSYAYINGEGFLPLLLAWSIDGEEVQQIDFTQQEITPEWKEHWWSLLNNPDYQKIAWNVTFEREVFRSCFRIDSPIEQWSDTMVWSRYAGYPGGLDAASKALGLPEDKAKMAEGKKLIQFFCKPFKGLRRDPSKYPERWELFKQYNRRDVEAEMEIRKIIGSKVDFPKREQTMWEIDQKINDQGILIDIDMAKKAIEMADKQKEILMQEAISITKLDNPNSIQQLKDWLGLEDEQTLRKADVSEMLKTTDDEQQKRVLEIRQELGKSSVKKYQAMVRSACPDDRVRGSIQFYGAGRTGRFSGKLIQPQNYPQNHIGDGSMRDLEYARKLVKERDFDGIKLLFGSINDTLSQLTRTALIPSKGNRFVVADFNAIEARVIAWLANERWRIKTFADGKDIYCASASQMFHVPVEKHGINGHLRQKGKVAELALGYNGGPGALIAMGALDMGLTEEELPELVTKWREASPNIVKLWYTIGNACMDAVRGSDNYIRVPRLGKIYANPDRLTIDLPSGRSLYYISPQIGVNRFGGDSLTYMGTNIGKWTRLETFGGKLVENCIAEGTLVVTSHGVVPIEQVTKEMLIWDGDSWVVHDGVIDKGIRETIETNGLHMTPEHMILTGKGWKEVGKSEGLDWADVQLPDLSVSRPQYPSRRCHLGVPLRLRKRSYLRRRRHNQKETPRKVLRMHARQADHRIKQEAWNVEAPGFRGMAQHEATLHGAAAPSMEKLRWPRNYRLRKMDAQLRKLLGGHGSNIPARSGAGSDRQRQGIQPGKLPLGGQNCELQQSKEEPLYQYPLGANDGGAGIKKIRDRSNDAPVQTGSRLARRITLHKTGLQEHVYDIRNCGPRHRFVICNGEECFVVHNCVQAIARDCLCTIIHRVTKRLNLYPVTHIHDEIVLEAPEAEAEETLQKVLAIMAEPISWAPGLTLKGAGYIGSFYFKD